MTYSSHEKAAISELIDELPALFYGRDDDAWEEIVLRLAQQIVIKRYMHQDNHDRRLTHAADPRQAQPL